jgi:DHA3 family macrolide efflux protein-like MFS transporter
MTESSEGTTTETTEYGALHKALSTETVTTTSENDNNEISYWGLLKKNREFRFYISSYLITHIGEWLTYIASIDFIESQQELQGTTSRTAISVLVIVRLMPNVLLSSVGGTLADAIDRRELMILLDVSGALCALCFVFAYEVQSVFLIYVATFLQQCIAGLYQPSSSSIIPLMVNHDNELKKATTLQGLAWSGMSAFGAAASGFIVNAVGSRTCFCK